MDNAAKIAQGSHVTVSGMTGLARIPTPALDWSYRYLLARVGELEDGRTMYRCQAVAILRGVLRWIDAERVVRGTHRGAGHRELGV